MLVFLDLPRQQHFIRLALQRLFARQEEVARHLLAEPEVQAIGLGARDSLRLATGMCQLNADLLALAVCKLNHLSHWCNLRVLPQSNTIRSDASLGHNAGRFNHPTQ